MSAVYKKELRGYFYSPIGYAFIGIFMLVLGVVFLVMNISGSSADYASTMTSAASFFGFLVPLITMRSFAEERRNKTDQLLITAPVRISSVVMGKFFAAVTVLAITLALSIIYPIIIAVLGSPSAGEIVSAYVGFFLMGCASIAIGIMISAATQSQVVAAVATFGVFFMLLMASNVINLINSGFIRQALTAVSLFDRMKDFSSGILGLSPIIYYISICGVCIFVTVRLIERRRWSGD
ncbi:MAG: ABC transporter permease subunit [Firmicutes bacterium]|nr:ABC transporter permease subunit [Bacillota bacterium]